ncbi:hypothetical protein A2130_02500 [Candidatus Woesebacteria bacterium GWC2_33_12]|uniref:Uncharacterized protein n=1 Tax=Candidatus Woesebacteria bacterium GW2011_GWB1_33_22 TaxID=1618566 RepID=A0A0G0C0X0_9BACT|nr:MAG: hypothetical protein UR29_C0021G0007 [Candidatus Woesebacteria bacterium GW2011_GWC2_33_12]KKP42019.1 MAG: hypothetical protein UR33_C0006G0003 [Candidatus Woesebacteria bacterium GW2011_GWA2_33_20]KKP44830.1 MAG: hypothetical protein UR35_C0006G0065 [Candidatus Woesebacteria bacterium GW2011_GWB1_33_22]KKP45056.1 MAG: hypothetical protein UR37_C0021G0007 [Microgenomates group bacterium GW2011_GWC1_33_28]KKP50562.1 MAG: hypothetical protein UR41_C0006G0065 [Candidatus Woesebacteria bact
MTEPISLGDPAPSFFEKHILGEQYLEYHKEPLVKVAGQINGEYRGLLEKMGEGDHKLNANYFEELALKRKEVCEARLQASKNSRDHRLRDQALGWEAELWYTDIALESLHKDGVDKRVLKAVTRSIAGEMKELDREAYEKRKFSKMSATIGNVVFEKRVLAFAKIND